MEQAKEGREQREFGEDAGRRCRQGAAALGSRVPDGLALAARSGGSGNRIAKSVGPSIGLQV
jgi:hypothetical protein